MPEPTAEPLEKYVPFIFQFPVIVRLKTKGGEVYELGKQWPEPFHADSTYPVSFIIERGASSEHTPGDDDDDFEYEEERVEHHFEVWAVPPGLMTTLYSLLMPIAAQGKKVPDLPRQLADALSRVEGTRCREVSGHDVRYVEKEIPTAVAWPTIQEHFEDLLGLDSGSRPDAKPVAQPQPNGG